MALRVYCVVEGHGDVDAFPILVRRLCQEVFGEFPHVEVPYRLPKGKITRAGDLSAVLTLGKMRLDERAEEGDKLLILVSRDADDDCPVEVAGAILSIAATTIAKDVCAPVIPDEEFEAWLLAGASALTNHADCNSVPFITNDADAVSSPKGVFERLVLKPGRTYSETVDQPKFAAQFEISDTTFARSRSLRRLRDVIERAYMS